MGAIECATLTPAEVLKIDNCKGSIGPGKDADIVAINDKTQVLLTMVEGRIVYQAEELRRKERDVCGYK